MEKLTRYERKFEDTNIFRESSISTADELANAIQAEILKVFPDCYAKINFQTRLYSSISGKVMLGKDKSEWLNGIFHNDLLSCSFSIDNSGRDLPKDGNIEGLILQIEFNSSSFSINPEEGSYMAYGRVKVPGRKTKGDADKMVAYIKKYMLGLKSLLKQYEKELPDSHTKLWKKKKF